MRMHRCCMASVIRMFHEPQKEKQMKKRLYICLLAAAGALAALPAHSANVFFDDFSTWLEGDEDGKVVPLGAPTSTPLSGANMASATTNEWFKSDGGIYFASTNTPVVADQPPADSSNAAAMRIGYWSQPNYGRNVTINTGLPLETNQTYTLTALAKIKEFNGVTNLDETAVGQHILIMGYYSAPTTFVTLKSSRLDTIGALAWTTNSVVYEGTNLAAGAIGQSICIRMSRSNFVNSTNYQTWVDSVMLDAEEVEITTDPFDDYMASFGVTNALMAADADGDGIDNVTEWATGGDPTNAANTGLVGPAFIAQEGGTNVFAYVTPRQVDYLANGIGYYLEKNNNLVVGSWTNAESWIAGVAIGGFNAEFDAVTNHVGGVATENAQFLRLRVSRPGYNP